MSFEYIWRRGEDEQEAGMTLDVVPDSGPLLQCVTARFRQHDAGTTHTCGYTRNTKNVRHVQEHPRRRDSRVYAAPKQHVVLVLVIVVVLALVPLTTLVPVTIVPTIVVVLLLVLLVFGDQQGT